MSELNKLIELASKLPKGLSSDWAGSNHFEMTSDDEFFWLYVRDGLDGIENPAESIVGQRFGLLMDIAAEVGRLRDAGFFDKFLPKLTDLIGLFKHSPVDIGSDWVMPRFIVCRICGNKRCPKAEDEKYKCTGSNETGQICELESADDEAETK